MTYNLFCLPLIQEKSSRTRITKMPPTKTLDELKSEKFPASKIIVDLPKKSPKFIFAAQYFDTAVSVYTSPNLNLFYSNSRVCKVVNHGIRIVKLELKSTNGKFTFYKELIYEQRKYKHNSSNKR